jgi:hypothetical protein
MSFVSVAKEFFISVANELDPYTTEKSKVNVNNFKSVTLETVRHVQFAKYGRGPGKTPPIDPLVKWLNKKGIVTNPKEARGTAFAIAKSISKNGTKNWVRGAPNAIEEAVSKHVTDYYKKLNNFTLDTQFTELEQIYKDNIPRKITIKL